MLVFPYLASGLSEVCFGCANASVRLPPDLYMVGYLVPPSDNGVSGRCRLHAIAKVLPLPNTSAGLQAPTTVFISKLALRSYVLSLSLCREP